MDALLKSFVTEKMKEISKSDAAAAVNQDLKTEENGIQDISEGEASEGEGHKSKKKKSKKKKDKKEKKSKSNKKRKKSSDGEISEEDDVPNHKMKKSGFYEEYEQVKEILEDYDNPGTDRLQSREDNYVKRKREASPPERYDERLQNSDRERYSRNRRRSRSRSGSNGRYSRGYNHDRSRSRYSRNRRSPPSYRDHRYRRRSRSRSPDPRKEIKTYILPSFNTSTLTGNKTGPSFGAAASSSNVTKTVKYEKPKAEDESVESFVKLCRQIAKEKDERESSPVNKPWVSDEESEADKQWKTRSDTLMTKPMAHIQMNIPNATQLQLPVYKPSSELRVEFPVASGEDHREHNENIAKGKIDVQEDPVKAEKVFPEMPAVKPDINKAMREKSELTKALDANPYDTASLIKLHKVEKLIHQWSICNKEPGKFTGTTKVQCLTQRQLEGDDPYNNAVWARKDMFKKTRKLDDSTVGLGKKLLEKMGWKPGQPLGKRQNGDLEPIDLSFNLDRKGLCGEGEVIGSGPVYSALQGLEGRNPVSALGEICRKRGWGNAYYEQVSETGPAHKRIFHFKVRVNNVDYIPHTGSNSKKQAKADAAAGALFALGLT